MSTAPDIEDFYGELEQALPPDCLTWKPRPDQPERLDQQQSFYESTNSGVSFLVGGNGAGCLAEEQEVYDPVLCAHRRVSDIKGDFHVWARADDGSVVVAKASQPRIYGTEDLYEVTLSNGRSVRITLGHRVFCRDGEWREVGELLFRHRNEAGGLRIVGVKFLRTDHYWDFSVEKYKNYWMEGAWHHNTTEAAMAKVAKFILEEQEAPRPDTPFWIIAGSYDQCQRACWKEKLSPRTGHGHLPDEEIDWQRIHWHRSKESLPFSVPLKPWHHGKNPNHNWTLKFKSYEQGREAMQAESIGGFCFVEQFPWSLLVEVLRGCREYSFTGSKLCEFTPVDPELSYQLQEFMEEDSLPPGWHVYRANTECALEAGHVSRQWFEEFYGMISGDERETRLTGAWASFEGLIYQEFNPLIHLVSEAECFPNGDFPPNVQHRRGIDWGAGPENPFAAVWAYRNGYGEYWIYDEYYNNSQKLTIVDHLANVSDQWHWPQNNPHYGITFADPAGRDFIKSATMFSQYKPGYENMSIQGANHAVYPGIQHVKYLLKTHAATKRPKLFICKTKCPNLAREIQTYRWLKGSINSANPRDARPEPLKKNDHAVDALRYMVFSEANQLGQTVEAVAHNHSRRSIKGTRWSR